VTGAGFLIFSGYLTKKIACMYFF